MNKKLGYIFYLLGFSLVVFLSIEIVLNYWLNNPNECPEKWLEKLIEYNREYDTKFIQQEEGMAMYDSSLFYTLKPGKFVFENREYSTPYSVNSLGVRDDEESLNYPKVVMLGDSYGMGFGVHQDETYAELVEHEFGVKVLNAGISSYGTPRELELLNRIKTDSMDYLIIQYCPNDYIEIENYVRHNGKLRVSSEQVYDSICEVVRDRVHYYPFKTTVELLPALIKSKKEPSKILEKGIKREPVNAVKGFIDVIRASKKIPATAKIVIFTLDGIGYKNHFLKGVENTLNKSYASTLHDQTVFLDFSQVLKPENYFTLDVHINASAHRIVADSLIKLIGKKKQGKHNKEWYYENGSVSIRSNYLNHFKHGETVYYWPNGKPSMISNYNYGVKDGEEVWFNEEGATLGKKHYKMGEAL